MIHTTHQVFNNVMAWNLNTFSQICIKCVHFFFDDYLIFFSLKITIFACVAQIITPVICFLFINYVQNAFSFFFPIFFCATETRLVFWRILCRSTWSGRPGAILAMTPLFCTCLCHPSSLFSFFAVYNWILPMACTHGPGSSVCLENRKVR